MSSAPCVCAVSESPTLYVSVIAGVLLVISEFLGFYNKRNSSPTSITEVAARAIKTAIKLATPPTTPAASVHEIVC